MAPAHQFVDDTALPGTPPGAARVENPAVDRWSHCMRILDVRIPSEEPVLSTAIHNYGGGILSSFVRRSVRHARAGGHPDSVAVAGWDRSILDSRPGLLSAGVTFFRGNDGIHKTVVVKYVTVVD